MSRPARRDHRRTVTVRVDGTPVPQGSKRALGPGRLVDDNPGELKAWRAAITLRARAATRKAGGKLTGPVDVDLVFLHRRPLSHHVGSVRTGPLRDGVPYWHPNTPDVDKLARAVLDALTQAGTIADDRLVAKLTARKLYADTPASVGVIVRVTELPERLS